ncbi:MAG TPA: MFS transporter [Solirubrobacterales bacterium]|nr:MFS transporter [Solirubrobacterales bacterium]
MASRGSRKQRSKGVQRTFDFIVSLTFLLLIEALGRSGAFWFYGAVGILTLVFCWKLVPEMKGKRLEDIQAYFEARVKS